MIGGARRQLPSWMRKSDAADQPSISEVKDKVKQNDSVECDTKPCKLQKKVSRNKYDKEVPLMKNKSHVLKKCEARSSKRKSINEEEDQCNDLDEGDLEKIVDVTDDKRLKDGDELHLLRKCEATKRPRMSKKQHEDQGDDLWESDTEKQSDVVVRKRNQGNAAPRRKKQKAKESIKESHDGAAESISSDDELTVEDLISIAKEYVRAEKEELQQSQKVGSEAQTKTSLTDISGIGSEKDLTAHLEDRPSVTDKQLSPNFPSREPSFSRESIINPSNASDPAQTMLELFLGPLLKKL